MSLIVITWGGHIYDDTTAGNAIEIWSSSMAAIGPVSPKPAQVDVDNLAAVVSTFHTDTGTKIHATVGLEWVKMNSYDVTTGRQDQDPTNEHIFTTPVRGNAMTSVHPTLTVSCRVSMDNGTRNRSTRGGFYLPRYAGAVGLNGRFSSTAAGQVLTSATSFVNAVNALSSYDMSVGVWSRKNHSITAITRLRVGDVPDNISNRKDALPETYVTGAITP